MLASAARVHCGVQATFCASEQYWIPKTPQQVNDNGVSAVSAEAYVHDSSGACR